MSMWLVKSIRFYAWPSSLLLLQASVVSMSHSLSLSLSTENDCSCSSPDSALSLLSAVEWSFDYADLPNSCLNSFRLNAILISFSALCVVKRLRLALCMCLYVLQLHSADALVAGNDRTELATDANALPAQRPLHHASDLTELVASQVDWFFHRPSFAWKSAKSTMHLAVAQPRMVTASFVIVL